MARGACMQTNSSPTSSRSVLSRPVIYAFLVASLSPGYTAYTLIFPVSMLIQISFAKLFAAYSLYYYLFTRDSERYPP